MIQVNNNYCLSLLFSDVYHVLHEATKEFDSVEYFFDFDSRNKRVKCVRFWFEARKPYYASVYPYNVELFNYLDRMKQSAFGCFTYVRHSVNVLCEDGVKKYSLVLWY